MAMGVTVSSAALSDFGHPDGTGGRLIGKDQQANRQNLFDSLMAQQPGKPGRSGGRWAETHHFDADVVVASGGQGQIEERPGSGFRSEIRIDRGTFDLNLGDVAPKTVGTEQQAVAGHE